MRRSVGLVTRSPIRIVGAGFGRLNRTPRFLIGFLGLHPTCNQSKVRVMTTDQNRRVYLYRLDVEYPPADFENDAMREWVADHEQNLPWPSRFHWPSARMYLSRTAAHGRADLLRSYGATVTVVRSHPVTFPPAIAVKS